MSGGRVGRGAGRYDQARRLYARLLPFMTSLERRPRGIQRLRAGLELLGLPTGQSRGLYLPLKAAEKDELKQHMADMGVGAAALLQEA